MQCSPQRQLALCGDGNALIEHADESVLVTGTSHAPRAHRYHGAAMSAAGFR